MIRAEKTITLAVSRLAKRWAAKHPQLHQVLYSGRPMIFGDMILYCMAGKKFVPKVKQVQIATYDRAERILTPGLDLTVERLPYQDSDARDASRLVHLSIDAGVVDFLHQEHYLEHMTRTFRACKIKLLRFDSLTPGIFFRAARLAVTHTLRLDDDLLSLATQHKDGVLHLVANSSAPENLQKQYRRLLRC